MPIQDFKCFAIIDYLKSVIDYSLYPTAISNQKSFTDYMQLNQLLITMTQTQLLIIVNWTYYTYSGLMCVVELCGNKTFCSLRGEWDILFP